MGKENLTTSFFSKEINFFQQNLKQIGIIFSLVILISLLFPGGEALKYSYKINDVTREPIIAPFTFSIQKTKEKAGATTLTKTRYAERHLKLSMKFSKVMF